MDSISTRVSDPFFKPRLFEARGEYKFDLGLAEWTEAKDEVATAYVYINSNFDFTFSKYLKGRLSPFGRFYSGRSQERFDEDDLGTQIYLNDFYASVEPIEELKFKIGGHSQSILEEPMLVSNHKTFPGFQQIGEFRINENSKVSAILQQVVPTSHSLNTEREKKEELPTFLTSQIRAETRLFKALELKVQAGLFSWSNIPSNVVYESRQKGNLGLGETVPGSRFAYDHKGWFSSAKACLCSDLPVGLKFEFSRLRNTAAPDAAADAQMWGVGPFFKYKSYELDLRYRNYFIESDATVASYNKSRLGHTNRIGEHFEANLHFADAGFSVYGEWYRIKPINPHYIQRDLNEFFIGVETDYASF